MPRISHLLPAIILATALHAADTPNILFFLVDDIKAFPITHRPQQFAPHFPNGRHNNELFTAWIDGDWKLIYQCAERDWQLVNLTDDIGEQQNLLAGHPQLALAMAKRMMIIKGDDPPSRVAQALAVSDSPTGPFHLRENLVFDRYSEDVSVWTDPGRRLAYGILHGTLRSPRVRLLSQFPHCANRTGVLCFLL